MIIFLDTNVFLECNNLKDLDWSPITKEKNIKIALCYKVIEELDKHKTNINSRVAKKASNAIKIIGNAIEKNETITAFNNYSLEIINTKNYSQNELAKVQNLDISVSDDFIIATIACYMNDTSESVILISHDLGIRLKCRGIIECKDVPESWILENSESEGQKEKNKLLKELNDLKNKQPKIQIHIDSQNYLSKTNKAVYIKPFSDEYINELLLSIKDKYPKKVDYEDKSIIFRDGLPIMRRPAGKVYKMPSEYEISEYIKEYDKWENQIRTKIKNFHYLKGKNSCYYLIEINLENSGNIPAENFQLTICSNLGEFVDFDEDIFIENNDFPIPPKAPEGEWVDEISLRLNEIFPNNFPSYLNPYIHPITTPQIARDKFAFYSYFCDKSATIECDEFQHKLSSTPIHCLLKIEHKIIQTNPKLILEYSYYAKNIPEKIQNKKVVFNINYEEIDGSEFITQQLKDNGLL